MRCYEQVDHHAHDAANIIVVVVAPLNFGLEIIDSKRWIANLQFLLMLLS